MPFMKPWSAVRYYWCLLIGWRYHFGQKTSRFDDIHGVQTDYESCVAIRIVDFAGTADLRYRICEYSRSPSSEEYSAFGAG